MAMLRVVSRWEVVALSINDVVGSGVYLLPAAAAMLLGSASLWAVPAAGLCAFLVVLCFAEAGSLFDEPGGGYVYTRAAFGDFIGFEVGWMTWLARVSAAAGLSAGFAQALTTFWPAAAARARPHRRDRDAHRRTDRHQRDRRQARGTTAVVLTLCKMLPLVLLLALSMPALEWERILPIAAAEPQALGAAALLLLFAYAGFENTAAPAGEFTNPRRDIPFALLIMIASVTALYTLVQLVALGTVPNLAETQTPLADAGRAVAGSFGASLLAIGALLSILGTSNNTVLAGSRYCTPWRKAGTSPLCSRACTLASGRRGLR